MSEDYVEILRTFNRIKEGDTISISAGGNNMESIKNVLVFDEESIQKGLDNFNKQNTLKDKIKNKEVFLNDSVLASVLKYDPSLEKIMLVQKAKRSENKYTKTVVNELEIE